ncbi:hypothetical protein [Vibrio diazotrophicus]|uniref:hypothetical protein n=1 Tax=Vibrio diazotrophicus TaxID=685 RepID=UPI003D2F5D2F
MRSAINTCLMILFLLVVLFSSFSRAADCPIGDTPVLTFPLGTSQIYSTCTNGCRAEDNFSSTSTWTCSETVGYCTAAFFTTGESCTGSDDTDGSCDVNGDCSPNDNGSGNDGGDGSDGGDGGNGDNSDGFCQLGDANCVKRIAQQADKILVRQTQDRKYLYTAIGTYAYQTESNIKKAIQDSNADNLFSTELIVKDGFVAQLEELNKLADGISNLKALNDTNKSSSEGLLKEIKTLVLGVNDQNMRNFYGTEDNISSLRDFQSFALTETRNNFKSAEAALNQAFGTFKTEFKNTNEKIGALNQGLSGLSSDIGTLSGKVDGLSTSIGDGLSSIAGELDGLSTSIGDGLSSIAGELGTIGEDIGDIEGLLNGDGLTVGTTEGQVDFAANGLYSDDAITTMQNEITALENEYSDQLAAMKQLFSFNSSSLTGGNYVEHKWSFNVQGRSYSFASGVFPALLDNSGLIAAVLLFLAVLFGVRFLVK